MDTTIYVVNKSTQVSDQDIAAATAAVSSRSPSTLPSHGFVAAPVPFLGKGAQPPAMQARIISVQDVWDDPQGESMHAASDCLTGDTLIQWMR